MTQGLLHRRSTLAVRHQRCVPPRASAGQAGR